MLVFKGNNTKIVNLSGLITGTGPAFCKGNSKLTALTANTAPMKGFDVDAGKLIFPFDNKVDVVQIVMRKGYKNTIIHKVALEVDLPSGSQMGSFRTNFGQGTRSVRPS